MHFAKREQLLLLKQLLKTKNIQIRLNFNYIFVKTLHNQFHFNDNKLSLNAHFNKNN